MLVVVVVGVVDAVGDKRDVGRRERERESSEEGGRETECGRPEYRGEKADGDWNLSINLAPLPSANSQQQ